MTSLLKLLQNRNCIEDCTNFSELEKTLNNEKLNFYCGFDPTANSLHVGSMLPLLTMRRLQKFGHKPIVVLGSATGMIGDPSGKSQERVLLDQEAIDKNLSGIEKQIQLFLEPKGNVGYEIQKNDSWLKNINLIEFLRDYGKHFSINSMIAKDSVKSRLQNREQGISYTEFTYMILQAYDFYHLYENSNCKLQIGGSDQWGNITAGIDLIKRKSADGNKANAFGLTIPLLTTSSGAKFGKTEEGTVWLDPNKTSPYKFYQYWLNTEDADVVRYLNLFTEFESKKIDELQKEVETNPGKREAQKSLAYDITKLVHGETNADEAATASKILFGGDLKDVDAKLLLEIFSEVPSTTISTNELSSELTLQDLLVKCKISNSKGSAKKLISSGGIYINNERNSDYQTFITPDLFIENQVLIIRSGKKNYHLLKLS